MNKYILKKYIQLYPGKYFPEGTPKHGFMKFQSYDKEVSFEQVCRCGFHTADDLLFMDHVDKRGMTP